jgi:hypothetical protein
VQSIFETAASSPPAEAQEEQKDLTARLMDARQNVSFKLANARWPAGTQDGCPSPSGASDVRNAALGLPVDVDSENEQKPDHGQPDADGGKTGN